MGIFKFLLFAALVAFVNSAPSYMPEVEALGPMSDPEDVSDAVAVVPSSKMHVHTPEKQYEIAQRKIEQEMRALNVARTVVSVPVIDSMYQPEYSAMDEEEETMPEKATLYDLPRIPLPTVPAYVGPLYPSFEILEPPAPVVFIKPTTTTTSTTTTTTQATPVDREASDRSEDIYGYDDAMPTTTAKASTSQVLRALMVAAPFAALLLA